MLFKRIAMPPSKTGTISWDGTKLVVSGARIGAGTFPDLTLSSGWVDGSRALTRKEQEEAKLRPVFGDSATLTVTKDSTSTSATITWSENKQPTRFLVVKSSHRQGVVTSIGYGKLTTLNGVTKQTRESTHHFALYGYLPSESGVSER